MKDSRYTNGLRATRCHHCHQGMRLEGGLQTFDYEQLAFSQTQSYERFGSTQC